GQRPRKDAWQPAGRAVRHRTDLDLGEQPTHGAYVDTSRLEQLVGDAPTRARQLSVRRQAQDIEHDAQRERETVRVNTGRSEAEDHVTGTHRTAVDDSPALDDAHR